MRLSIMKVYTIDLFLIFVLDYLAKKLEHTFSIDLMMSLMTVKVSLNAKLLGFQTQKITSIHFVSTTIL